MDREPLVSIMIPTYNQSQYIGDAINSILNQSYKNIEVIVLDDQSTDDTSSVVKKIEDNRIRYIRNETNLGRVQNYHNGLYNNTQGDWILNLDGDDFLTDQHYIEDCIEILNAHPSVKLIFGGFSFREEKALRSKKYKKFKGKDYLLKNYIPWRSNHMTSLYHRQSAVEVGFYTQNILSSDSESFLRICAKGDIIYKEGIAGYWRPHGQNFTLKSEISSKVENFFTLAESINSFYSAENTNFSVSPKELKGWNKKMSIHYLTPLLYASIRKFSIKDAMIVLSAFRRYNNLKALYKVPLFILNRLFFR